MNKLKLFKGSKLAESNPGSKTRKKASAEDFGDPERRLFPIMDQDDVDSAARLIGKAKNPDAVKKRIISIAKRKGLKIPEAWTNSKNTDDDINDVELVSGEDTLVFTATLDNDSRTVKNGMVVYPNSILFEAGTYKENGEELEFGPEYLWVLENNFDRPVGGNIQHTKFLAGKAGQITSITVDSEDNSLLRGTVEIPEWLDEHLDPHERKLSIEFDYGDLNSVVGFALCTNPRVKKAELLASFTEYSNKTLQGAKKRHDTSAGKSAIQSLHNMAARAGAVCKYPGGTGNMTAKFVSKHESQLFQSVHDMTVEHGAACDDGSKPEYMYYSEGEESEMKRSLFVAALATQGLTVLSGKVAKMTIDDSDESMESLAKAISEEIQSRVANDPIRAMFTAAGVKDEADAKIFIASAQFGLQAEKEMREECKKLCIRANGQDGAKPFMATIDKADAELLISLKATFTELGNQKFGRNTPQERQTAPNTTSKNTEGNDRGQFNTVVEIGGDDDNEFPKMDSDRKSKLLAATEIGRKAVAAAAVNGNGNGSN